MCNNWIETRKKYCWSVDLRKFKNAEDYPGYFDRTINPEDTESFEDKFRKSIDHDGSFVIAGEVYFWKFPINLGWRNVQDLLIHLKDQGN